MARKKDAGAPLPVVRVAPLGELKAYTVSEHELERMARGSAVSDLLTVGYALLSVAATLLATLLSTSLPDLHFVIFICAFLIFALAGGICLLIGWRTRESVRALMNEIRSRMPPPPAIREMAARQLTFTEMTSVETLEPGEPTGPAKPTPPGAGQEQQSGPSPG